MKGLKLGVLLSIITVVFIGMTLVMMYVSYNNKYVELTNLFKAQEKKDEVVYDNLWKVIQSEGQVASKYSEEFRKNYQAIISSRNYGGEMMKWIKEHNPEFSPALYIKLANVVESQRASFLANQTALIDYHREIDNLVHKLPSSIFVGSLPVPELHVVTSTKTDEVFTTHKEDSVRVF